MSNNEIKETLNLETIARTIKRQRTEIMVDDRKLLDWKHSETRRRKHDRKYDRDQMKTNVGKLRNINWKKLVKDM